MPVGVHRQVDFSKKPLSGFSRNRPLSMTSKPHFFNSLMNNVSDTLIHAVLANIGHLFGHELGKESAIAEQH